MPALVPRKLGGSCRRRERQQKTQREPRFAATDGEPGLATRAALSGKGAARRHVMDAVADVVLADVEGPLGPRLREILLASQAGAYLEGSARRHHKLALVGGTAHEYSVAEAVRFLVDLDYTVVLMLAVTGGLGIASKRATAHELCERYGAKVFASYDWPLPAHLGPEPPGWARLAARVRKEDDEFHQAWAVEHAAQLGRGRTSQDVPVVRDGRDLGAQLGRAS